jgi:hypothetical protein
MIEWIVNNKVTESVLWHSLSFYPNIWMEENLFSEYSFHWTESIYPIVVIYLLQ